MKKYPCFSKKQIEVMIKYYYMKSPLKVAQDENITTNQVRTFIQNGLRALRLGYAPLLRKGEYFDSLSVLQNIAKRENLIYEEFYNTIQQHITEGLSSDNREYWKRIVNGKPATPIDLISFFWAKFEADIEPIYCWDIKKDKGAK